MQTRVDTNGKISRNGQRVACQNLTPVKGRNCWRSTAANFEYGDDNPRKQKLDLTAEGM